MIPQPGQPQAPNPQLQKAQQELQQIQQRLEQIQENKQVLALLRDEKTRGCRIEIETDSTIEPDEQAEKQRRVEFLEVSSKFFQTAMPMLQTIPQAAPMLAESYLFLVRGFRAGRQLEDTVENTMQAISQQAQQPRSDPEQQKVEAQLKHDAERHQQEMAQSQQLHKQAMELQAEQGLQKLAIAEQSHAATMKEKEDAGIQANAGEIKQALGDLMKQVDAMAEDAAAPADIIRGPDGRIVAVQRGNRTIPVRRTVVQ